MKNGCWKEDELAYEEVKLGGGMDTGEWKSGKMEGIGGSRTSKLVYFGEFQGGESQAWAAKCETGEICTSAGGLMGRKAEKDFLI